MLLGLPAASAQPLGTLLNPPLANAGRLSAPGSLSSPDPLSTPSPLTSFAPLMPSAPLSGPAPASGKPGTPCVQRRTGTLSAGGSGPGEFGRFMPNGGSPATTPNPSRAESGAYPSSQPGVDRPLYGGIDRPLWDQGAADRPLWDQGGAALPIVPVPAPGMMRRGAVAAGSVEAGSVQAGSVEGGTVVPAPPMDRPLWSSEAPVRPCTPGQAGARTGSRTGAAPAP